MCCQCQVMAGLHIERKVHAEIVRHTVTVSVGIESLGSTQLLVVILSCRHGCRTSGAIVHVQRQAISTGELVVAHKLEIMRFVIFCRIPVTIIYRTSNTLVVLTKEGTRISITNPSVQSTSWFLGFQFHSISITFSIDDIRFEMGFLTNINIPIIEKIAVFSRKKNSINLLTKFVFEILPLISEFRFDHQQPNNFSNNFLLIFQNMFLVSSIYFLDYH